MTLLACSKPQSAPWPPEAPISLDTAAAILQELYLKRAMLNSEGLLTPAHDTLWHGYVQLILNKYKIPAARWDSLRKTLSHHPEAMVAIAETALTRLGK